ncbi:MAG TPA: hypothetical protein P5186_16250 [Candidatus Paceibacterota bacterium]|nr:hypothetical protein [Candidatus Paceibacterota bacterium]
MHRWLLSQANRCRLEGMQPETTHSVLRDGTRACGRTVPDSEIRAAVKTAYESTWSPIPRSHTPGAHACSPSSAWPKPNQDSIEKITASGFGLADLWEESPVRIEDNRSRAEELITALFPGDPLLCIAKAKPADAKTAPRSTWIGQLDTSALIVPSPMSALTGKTKDGRESSRCLENTGPRRFLVIEFDQGDLDSQAGRIWHLAQLAPLALAVHSGGKSLHGWFPTHGKCETELKRFMARAVMIGADPATWTKCQMVRLPEGQREDGSPQRCFYFNPAIL